MSKNELFQNIADELLDGFWSWDIAKNELLLSTNFLQLLGYDEASMIDHALCWSDIIDSNDIATFTAQIQGRIYPENDFVKCAVRFRSIHKKEIPALLKGKVLQYNALGTPERLVGVVICSSEIETKYEEIAGNLRILLQSATHISIISTTVDGIITHFNKGAEILLGYSAEEMILKQTPELIHVKEEVIEHGNYLSEKFNRNIQGFDAFVELARQGNFESKEWTYVRKDGSKFPVQLVVTSVKNNNGEITGFLGIATDISELKQTQASLLSSMEHITYQNQKLLDFTYIASHNLKTHTRNINMLLQLMDSKEKAEDKKEISDMVKSQARSLYDTIQSLNEIIQTYHNPSAEVRTIQINEYVFKVIDLLQVDLDKVDACIDINVSNDVTINYNPVYFESVLFNLISNAIKYRNSKRKLNISISLSIVKNKPILQVKDNGMGIDLDKYGSKLFGLFKTFHNNKDARGVGLYITKSHIESMGGSIHVTSVPDQGTTFTIHL